MHLKPSKKFILTGILFSLLLFTPSLTKQTIKYITNIRFSQCMQQLFEQDVSSNGLNLHYTLAHPEKLHLPEVPCSLGSWDIHVEEKNRTQLENRISLLEQYPSTLLTPKNQLTKNILMLSWKTELSPQNQERFQECLSPSLGIQAQLPVLLAEYTFRKEQDVKDYLSLLSSVTTYFDGILKFQQEKSKHGTFMSDQTVDRVIEQCNSFIKNPQDNYLLPVFSEKISTLKEIPEEKKKAYETLHKKIIFQQFLPAYETLIQGLSDLKGTGNNKGGLGVLPGGKEYYQYLLKSNCGLYESVETIQKRLLKQLQMDMEESQKILTTNPQLALDSTQDYLFSEKSPQELLELLKKLLEKDFPPAPETSYQVKYVHKDLEAYLSPAFYLTPPIDTLSPNDIYINPYACLTGVSLFTTLAHEGFPGHLYQTISFASTHPPKIRQIQNMGGYVEGWATYVESYAHGYARSDSSLSRLEWLNHSLNLCVLSLLDTGIHYNGWNLEKSKNFLSNFHITDTEIQEEIYQTILEDPANYLKYYMGYLHFIDLREHCKETMKDAFDIRQFHEIILKAGPCQFPILESLLKEELDLQSYQ